MVDFELTRQKYILHRFLLMEKSSVLLTVDEV